MRGRSSLFLLATVAGGGATASACAFIDRFPDVAPDPQVSAASGDGPSTGSGGGTTTLSGTGSAGESSGMPVMCSPSETVPCYDGAPSTEGKGSCISGLKTCNSDGMSFGFCVGQIVPRVEACASPEDENCDGVGCVGATQGALAFGDSAAQQGQAIAAFSDLVAVTGSASGQLTVGDDATAELGDPALADAFVARFDSSLTPLWSRRFSDVRGNGVAFAPKSGDLVVVGGAQGNVDFGGGALPSSNPAKQDVFVARFKAAGTHLSSQRYGDAAADQVATAVAPLDSGDVVITGSLAGSLDCKNGTTLTSAGGADVFLARLDPESKMLWCKSFGDGDDQQATGVAIAPGGDVVVVGSFSGSINFGDGLHSTGGGPPILLFVARFNPSGDVLWSAAFGNKGYARATGVAVDAGGNTFVSGFFSGQLRFGSQQKHDTSGADEDAFLVKLNASGAPVWSASLGDGADQQGLGVAVDAQGNALLTGAFKGQIDLGPSGKVAAGGRNIFAVKFDPGGVVLWGRGFGGATDQVGAAVAADPLGAAWLTGGFTGDVDFGAGPVTSAGATDAFLVKLTP